MVVKKEGMNKGLKITLITIGSVIGLFVLLFVGLVIYYMINPEASPSPNTKYNQTEIFADLCNKEKSINSFAHTYVFPSTGAEVKRMYFMRGDNGGYIFRSEWVTSDGKNFVSIDNGKKFYQYLPDENLAYVYKDYEKLYTPEELAKFDERPAWWEDLCSEDMNTYGALITGEDIVNNKPCYNVEFTKGEMKGVVYCYWKDYGLVLKHSKNGQLIWIWDKFEFNLDKKLFEIPSGVKFSDVPLMSEQ